MSEFNLASFFMWSIITGATIFVVGFSYRRYLNKNNPIS